MVILLVSNIYTVLFTFIYIFLFFFLMQFFIIIDEDSVQLECFLNFQLN